MWHEKAIQATVKQGMMESLQNALPPVSLNSAFPTPVFPHI